MTKTVVINLFSKDIQLSKPCINWFGKPLDILFCTHNVQNQGEINRFLSDELSPILFAWKAFKIKIIVLVNEKNYLFNEDKSLTYLLFTITQEVKNVMSLVHAYNCQLYFVFSTVLSGDYGFDMVNKISDTSKNVHYKINENWPLALKEILTKNDNVAEHNLEVVLKNKRLVIFQPPFLLDEVSLLSLIQFIACIPDDSYLSGKAFKFKFELSASLFSEAMSALKTKINDYKRASDFSPQSFNQYNPDSLQITTHNMENAVKSILANENALQLSSLEACQLEKVKTKSRWNETLEILATEKRKVISQLVFDGLSSESKNAGPQEIINEISSAENKLTSIQKEIEIKKKLLVANAPNEDEYLKADNEIVVELYKELQKRPKKFYFWGLMILALIFFIIVSIMLLINGIYENPYYLSISLLFIASIIWTAYYYANLHAKKLSTLYSMRDDLVRVTAEKLSVKNILENEIAVLQFKGLVIGKNILLLKEAKEKIEQNTAHLKEQLSEISILEELGLKLNTIPSEAKFEDNSYKFLQKYSHSLTAETLGTKQDISMPLNHGFHSITFEELDTW
jgi:hypothetical protein